jgi:GH25 family lysozyme M1 (1,4-beta-N-acetylmuramidase)
MADLHGELTAGRNYADALHDHAMLLGYNVGVNFSTHLENDEPAEVSFWVRRVDQPSGTEQTFATTAEVDQYLNTGARCRVIA